MAIWPRAQDTMAGPGCGHSEVCVLTRCSEKGCGKVTGLGEGCHSPSGGLPAERWGLAAPHVQKLVVFQVSRDPAFRYAAPPGAASSSFRNFALMEQIGFCIPRLLITSRSHSTSL